MKIFIDPGHNPKGADTGATGNGLREQDITYLIAAKLKPMLEKCGVEVKMSRNAISDSVSNVTTSASLSTRARMANDWKADLFVSIHCNAGGGTGAETFSYEGGISAGYKLACAVQDRIVKTLSLTDRDVKINSGLYVLRHTHMPAILVETAFIDHASDARLLGNKEGQVKFAEAIAQGICDYTGIEFVKGDTELMSKEYEELRTKIDDLLETVKALAVEVAESKNPMIYNYIDKNMPEWARASVAKAIEKGILKGEGDGLNLTYSDLRTIVREDRAGLYDLK